MYEKLILKSIYLILKYIYTVIKYLSLLVDSYKAFLKTHNSLNKYLYLKLFLNSTIYNEMFCKTIINFE